MIGFANWHAYTALLIVVVVLLVLAWDAVRAVRVRRRRLAAFRREHVAKMAAEREKTRWGSGR